MRSRTTALLAALVLLVSSAASVTAASANIAPPTESHAHNVSSSWTLSWGSTSPYHVEFYYGDGWVTIWQNTNIVGATRTHGYSPCPGEQTTYYQTLKVWDGWVDQTGHYKGFASDTSSAYEAAGTPC